MEKSKLTDVVWTCSKVVAALLVFFIFVYMFRSCIKDDTSDMSWSQVMERFCDRNDERCPGICPAPVVTTPCDFTFTPGQNCPAWEQACRVWCDEGFETCACRGCCSGECGHTDLCTGTATVDNECKNCTEELCVPRKKDCYDLATEGSRRCLNP